MKILFTASSSILSKLIRSVTKEPVSHCAIQIDDSIIQANLEGVTIEPLSSFMAGSLLAPTPTIVYQIDLPDNPKKVIQFLASYDRSWYDYLGLIYAGLQLLLPLPKKNLGHITGSFLCTEVVTEIVEGQPVTELTPYQLYLQLSAGESK
jgi:hypothetical protein